jgi:hypothetical protein
MEFTLFHLTEGNKDIHYANKFNELSSIIDYETKVLFFGSNGTFDIVSFKYVSCLNPHTCWNP